MDLRHLRCFLAVAEELSFVRAAERLHIEQSPLSRAGQMFLEHVPRIFTALQQARKSVKAVAAGYDGQLRVALSDGITPPRLSALLMQCREDDPEVDIHLVEVPLSQQIKGLHDDLYDVGFAQPDEVSDGLLAGLSPRLNTYLLRPDAAPTAPAFMRSGAVGRHGAAIRRVPRQPHVQTGFARTGVPRPFISPSASPTLGGTRFGPLSSACKLLAGHGKQPAARMAWCLCFSTPAALFCARPRA